MSTYFHWGQKSGLIEDHQTLCSIKFFFFSSGEFRDSSSIFVYQKIKATKGNCNLLAFSWLDISHNSRKISSTRVMKITFAFVCVHCMLLRIVTFFSLFTVKKNPSPPPLNQNMACSLRWPQDHMTLYVMYVFFILVHKEEYRKTTSLQRENRLENHLKYGQLYWSNFHEQFLLGYLSFHRSHVWVSVAAFPWVEKGFFQRTHLKFHSISVIVN